MLMAVGIVPPERERGSWQSTSGPPALDVRDHLELAHRLDIRGEPQRLDHPQVASTTNSPVSPSTARGTRSGSVRRASRGNSVVIAATGDRVSPMRAAWRN
jgi:hypothetical protein